jgi:hypothetical protein
MLIMDRHPRPRIRLHSQNPLAWVSAVRSALRQSRVDAAEISRFTDEALLAEPGRLPEVIARWAQVEVF